MSAPKTAAESDRARLIAVARGDAEPDLVIVGGRVLSVFTREWLTGDVAIADGRIAGVGSYAGGERVDAGGRYVVPGLIDAHVHVESAMVPPAELARMIVPRGVTAVVTDPHEIANVAGVDGIRWMIRDARRSPLAMYVNASSCVPATHLSTAGASLAAADLAPLLDEPDVIGLAEVMNFPGVVAGRPEVLDRILGLR